MAAWPLPRFKQRANPPAADLRASLDYCSKQLPQGWSPFARDPHSQFSNIFPTSVVASRLGRCSSVVPPPFLEPRGGPLQSSLKQHCRVAPPELPRRACSQKDL